MNHPATRRRAPFQRGVAAVEVALFAMIFFTFVFGVIELARALYVWGTMIEVTRNTARAAAAADFSDGAAMAALRSHAMFGDLPGGMPLRGNLSDANLSIDYLDGSLQPVAPLPACPAQNVINCAANPEGPSCIRFVRVRLCAEGGGATCTKVEYAPVVSANFFPGAPLHYPTFATITPAAALGYRPGAAGNCP